MAVTSHKYHISQICYGLHHLPTKLQTFIFIEVYFVVVSNHSACNYHLLCMAFILLLNVILILNRLMLSLGIFLCMIFILYSLNTSNHFIKGTDYFLIIALILFHMSFGSCINQYFESLSQWSLRYIWTYYNLQMSFDKCIYRY